MFGHTGKFPFQCTKCKQGFLKNYELKKHQLVHCEVKVRKQTHSAQCPKNCEHTETRKELLQCPRCPRGFSKCYELQIHLQIHSDKLAYKCAYCPNSFAHKSNFMAHICEHTGKFPHRCLQCLQGFMKRYDLMLHMQTHLQQSLIETQEPTTKIRRVDLKTIKDSLRIKSPGVLIKDTTKISKIKEEPQIETIKETTFPHPEMTRNTLLTSLNDKSLVETKADERPAKPDESFKCAICSRNYSNANELRLHEK